MSDSAASTNEAVASVTAHFEPRLSGLCEYLQQSGQIQAFGFFSQILATTQAVTDEGELLELFIQLSMTAFQGFQLDPVAATIVDDILLYAEQVSQTFSVDSDTVN